MSKKSSIPGWCGLHLCCSSQPGYKSLLIHWWALDSHTLKGKMQRKRNHTISDWKTSLVWGHANEWAVDLHTSAWERNEHRPPWGSSCLLMSYWPGPGTPWWEENVRTWGGSSYLDNVGSGEDKFLFLSPAELERSGRTKAHTQEVNINRWKPVSCFLKQRLGRKKIHT